MAAAQIGEVVEQQAGVYDLSRFLSTLALFDSPEVVFGTDRFTIKGGKSELRYTYTSESLIVSPPEKDIVVPDPEVSVDITWQAIDGVLRAAGVLQLPEIAFIGDGSSVTLSAVDSKTSTADNYNTVVADDLDTEPFNMIIKVDNLKLLPTMAHFKSEKVQYWAAIEAKQI
jgi:hypothetical protein